MARMRYRIRRTGRPPFGWTPDECGAVPGLSGGIQVEVVTRHHEEFVRAIAKPPRTGAVGHRLWLVGAHHLPPHHTAPGESLPPGHHQGRRGPQTSERTGGTLHSHAREP